MITLENRTGNGNKMGIRSLKTFSKFPLFLHGVAEPKHSLSCQIRALIGLVLFSHRGVHYKAAECIELALEWANEDAQRKERFGPQYFQGCQPPQRPPLAFCSAVFLVRE